MDTLNPYSLSTWVEVGLLSFCQFFVHLFLLIYKTSIKPAELYCAREMCEKKISEIKSNYLTGVKFKATQAVVQREHPAGGFQCL